MKKKEIYSNGSSKLEIEFDGEYFQVTQTITGLTTNTISVTSSELQEMVQFAEETKKSYFNKSI